MAEKHISAKIKSYFSAAANRQNLESGEEIQTSFGKIAKWLTDLKAVAFSGSYNDLSNKPSIPSSEVTETLDTTPYIYKSSEHDAVYDELVGGSVAWNQLIPTTGTSGDNKGVTFTNNGDGSWTLNGTTTSFLVFRNLNYAANKKNFVDGHKYLMYADSDDSNVGIAIVRDVGSAHYAYGKTAKIISYTEVSETASWARIQLSVSGYKVTNVITKPQIFDLTQMFGSTIADYAYNLEQSAAGSGIAWLKSYGFFTKDYYAYNAGVLISTNTNGKKVVSETTEIIYPIQSTDLRGLYKLNGNKLYTDGDIYSADGQITRKYGIVDLGTLNWGMLTNNRFYANVEEGTTGIITNALCTKYVVTNVAVGNLQDKQMNYGQPVVSAGWRAVAVRDSAYTDAATFKTAMSGVYLIYELSTPTTENARPFTSPQMVYRSGTEEYLDTRDVPIPVGGNRKYVDIPDWMVNEYFDDVRAETSNVSDIIEKLRRIDVSNRSSSTVRTIYAPDDSNGIQTTVRNNRTEVQVACGQASNANGKVVFTDSKIYGGIGNPTSLRANHFMFNDDCVGDSIGKLSSGTPLTGSEFDLNYETINLKGSTINIDDNMSMVFETENDFTVNTINSPYMMINTDGISLLPKTLSYFPLLISGLPSGAGSELVVNSNGTVYQSSSSRDIKHDIKYVENTESYHDALMRIKPATYVYNNDKTETTKLGMIAEDIADVMPIAALTGEGGKVENYDTRAIIAMLVMEVQRLNAEIERLRGDSDAD